MTRALQYAYLAAVLLFLAVPVGVIVVFSFDANRFPTIPWGGFSLDWHIAIFQDQMVIDAFVNSFSVAAATAVIATFLGFCAAYVDYRMRFRGQGLFVLLVAIPPAVPLTILGMAMLAFVSRIGLFGTVEGIVACHVAIAVSFAMAIIRQRLGEAGPDLEPAAWNLGAAPGRAIVNIVLPFCLPAVIAAFFLSAAISFDEFMIAWFVGGVHETVPVRVLNLLQGQVNPKINAIGTVVLAISVVLLLIARSATRLRFGQAKEE